MKYVSEHYEQTLDHLAETLMASKRVQLAQPSGEVALAQVVELHPRQQVELAPIPA